MAESTETQAKETSTNLIDESLVPEVRGLTAPCPDCGAPRNDPEVKFAPPDGKYCTLCFPHHLHEYDGKWHKESRTFHSDPEKLKEYAKRVGFDEVPLKPQLRELKEPVYTKTGQILTKTAIAVPRTYLLREAKKGESIRNFAYKNSTTERSDVRCLVYCDIVEGFVDVEFEHNVKRTEEDGEIKEVESHGDFTIFEHNDIC